MYLCYLVMWAMAPELCHHDNWWWLLAYRVQVKTNKKTTNESYSLNHATLT